MSREIQKNNPSFTDTETYPDNVEVLYPEEEFFILKKSGLSRREAWAKSWRDTSAQFLPLPSSGWVVTQTKRVQRAQIVSQWDPHVGSALETPHLQPPKVTVWAHQLEHQPPPWTGWWRASRAPRGAPAAGSRCGAWSRDPAPPWARPRATPAKANEIRAPQVQAVFTWLNSTLASLHFMLLMISLRGENASSSIGYFYCFFSYCITTL